MSGARPRSVARVAEPRPSSAYLLVAVASATLWITEQLAPWVMGVQTLAVGIAYLRRATPFAWQRSPIALNLGMFGITATTISVALHGNPSTVSLAHFAALTQGLQLLDVRPRKSEFLLVALALFQVILAANLTDSVLFPPLLVVFTASVTWTLLVHTLRTEAIAAGERASAERALTPSLARTTSLASIASILLAMVFFVSLPRLRTSMVNGGIGGSTAVSGFSDEVELGAIGAIRKDPRVVLRVETLEGTPPVPAQAYWRGLAFDHFDGTKWSITPVSELRARWHLPSSPRLGVDVGSGPERATLVQRIIREPVTSGVIFGSGPARRVEGPLDHLELDRNGGLYAPTQVEERVRYTLWSEPVGRDDRSLRNDRSARPPDRHQPPDPEDDRYYALPRLDPAIAELAGRIAGEASTDADRALAIETWLRREGRYTDSPSVAGSDERTPVEAFLLEGLSGHCEYFASSMVVLARSIGLPARLVNGFAGGRTNELGGFVAVTRADAHAWVEIHFENAGWVRYDPTPPDLRLRAMGELGLGERLAQIGSALETWWFQRIVDFDSSDQFAAVRGVLGAWRRFKTTSTTRTNDLASRWHSAPRWRDLAPPWPTTFVLAGALACVALGLRKLGGRRPDPVPRAYRRALQLLARRGIGRPASASAREFASSAAARLPDSGAQALAILTELYLAERFGGRDTNEASQRALAALRAAL